MQKPDWQATIGQMEKWLDACSPFCHLRFADGEFNSILGTASPNFGSGSNCDGHEYMTDTLGVALAGVLGEIAAKHPNHGNLLVGGGCWRPSAYVDYLREQGCLERIPWVGGQVFGAGIESLATKRFLVKLHDYAGRKILVGNAGIEGAKHFLGADFIEIPARNCWLKEAETTAELRKRVAPGSVVIYCAGMPAAVYQWRMWKAVPDSTHIDMGHIFDGIFGRESRKWLRWNNGRRRTYLAKYGPMILDAIPKR